MIINGKNCKYYQDGCVWVSYDGKFAACKNRNTGDYDEMTIVTDSFGKKIVNGPWNKMVPLAQAVAETHVAKPQQGGRYSVDFDDGNPDNCYYKNLSWVPYTYPANHMFSSTLSIFNSSCTVKRDGSVCIDGNVVKPMYYWKDKKNGTYAVGNPFVYVKACDGIHSYRIELDSIMKDCGYILGDDATLTSPVILHRDGDWMNFSASNLEWVEDTDQRFIQYQLQKQAAQNKELNKLNKRP